MIFQPRDDFGYHIGGALPLPSESSAYNTYTDIAAAGQDVAAVKHDRYFSVVATKSSVQLCIGSNATGQHVALDQRPFFFVLKAGDALKIKRGSSGAASCVLVDYGKTVRNF